MLRRRIAALKSHVDLITRNGESFKRIDEVGPTIVPEQLLGFG